MSRVTTLDGLVGRRSIAWDDVDNQQVRIPTSEKARHDCRTLGFLIKAELDC